MAAPGRTETFVAAFFEETGIAIDWELSESVWRSAGRAFQSYAERRRKQRDKGARRILADFLIGAHALTGGVCLCTFFPGTVRGCVCGSSAGYCVVRGGRLP